MIGRSWISIEPAPDLGEELLYSHQAIEVELETGLEVEGAEVIRRDRGRWTLQQAINLGCVRIVEAGDAP